MSNIETTESFGPSSIAIIGIAGRFPGAADSRHSAAADRARR